MISLECPIPGCGYSTPEASEVVACALLAAHTPVHTAPSLISNVGPANGPKLERPKVDIAINKEDWNINEDININKEDWNKFDPTIISKPASLKQP